MIPLMPHEVVQKNDIGILYCQAHRLVVSLMMPGAKFLIQKIMSIIKWLLFSVTKFWSGLLDKNGLLEHTVLRTP